MNQSKSESKITKVITVSGNERVQFWICQHKKTYCLKCWKTYPLKQDSKIMFS